MASRRPRRLTARQARHLERFAYGFLCAVSVAGASAVLTAWATLAFA